MGINIALREYAADEARRIRSRVGPVPDGWTLAVRTNDIDFDFPEIDSFLVELIFGQERYTRWFEFSRGEIIHARNWAKKIINDPDYRNDPKNK